MDDGYVDPLTPGELNAFFDNYRALKHGDPQEEVEPTLEQVSAFNARVVTLQLAPYGDFSILTPFGRRMAKVLKHRAWIPNPDGPSGRSRCQARIHTTCGTLAGVSTHAAA